MDQKGSEDQDNEHHDYGTVDERFSRKIPSEVVDSPSKNDNVKVLENTSGRKVPDDQSLADPAPEHDEPDVSSEPGTGALTTPPSALQKIRALKDAIQRYPISSGAFLGAIIAIAAVFLLLKNFPPIDPRISEISLTTNKLTDQITSQGLTLQSIETDLARTIGATSETVAVLKEHEAQFNGITEQIAATERALVSQQSPGSPMFGIAAAQLVNNISAGKGFAPEWVNLYALAGNSPELQQDLQRLMPLAHTGVRTIEDLKVALTSYRDQIFFPDSGFSRIWVRSLSAIQYKLGLPIARTTKDEVALQHVNQALDHLKLNDVKSAEYVISSLSDPYSEQLSNWVEAARRHQVAKSVGQDLVGIAEQALRQRLQ